MDLKIQVIIKSIENKQTVFKEEFTWESSDGFMRCSRLFEQK